MDASVTETIARNKGMAGADARLAVLALGLLNKSMQVVIDPDDLATSLTNLLASPGAGAKIVALGIEGDIDYTPENVVNKSTNVTTDGASDTKYPSVKAVKDYVDAAEPSAIADGTYTVGIGATTNGTITFLNGKITAIQEAAD